MCDWLIMEVNSRRTIEFTVNGGEYKMFDTNGAKITQVCRIKTHIVIITHNICNDDRYIRSIKMHVSSSLSSYNYS